MIRRNVSENEMKPGRGLVDTTMFVCCETTQVEWVRQLSYQSRPNFSFRHCKLTEAYILIGVPWSVRLPRITFGSNIQIMDTYEIKSLLLLSQTPHTFSLFSLVIELFTPTTHPTQIILLIFDFLELNCRAHSYARALHLSLRIACHSLHCTHLIVHLSASRYIEQDIYHYIHPRA